MSLVLGPIHYWLYNKIRFQEEITSAIAEQLPNEGKSDRYVRNLVPLEQAVDTANIHGSLQKMIHDAEERNAGLVTELLNSGISMKEMEKVARRTGEKHAASVSSAIDAYKALDDLLLNGMPCDRVSVILDQGEDEVVFSLVEDIHGDSWNAMEGDVANYYILRKAAANGAIRQSGFVLDNNDMTYIIKRV